MSKKDLRNMWRAFRDLAVREKKIIACFFVMTVLGAVRPYINVVLMGYLLDAVYEGNGFAYLLRLALLCFGCNGLLSIIESRARQWFNQKNEYLKEIESRAFNDKSLRMDYEYLEDLKVQGLRFRGQEQYSSLGIVGHLLYEAEFLIKSGLIIIIAFVILIPLFLSDVGRGTGFLATWYSAAFLLVLIGGMVWLNYKKILYYTKLSEDEWNAAESEYNRGNYYLDLLAKADSQKDLRIYGHREPFLQDYSEMGKEIESVNRKQAKIWMRKGFISQTVSDGSGLLVYLFTALRAYAGVITIGGVVTYAASIIRFSQAVAELASSMGYMKLVATYCGDYVEYMELDKRKYQGTIPVEKRRDNRFKVEFEHVSFRYPGTDVDVIKDLNLEFTIGERMAIVGKNGSGKTTFIKLLCRLYDVTEGCIKVNGIDIRKYDYRDYCNLFAVVFQDFRMFAFTLGENIAASDEVDEERAKDALVRAGLGERLKELPDGLATYVGKDFASEGVNFSGGEKQKMAIARAIYKNAPFVIMDEPTAALDPESECEVYAGFDKMVGNKTALYISHRLASCRFCQDILVFDKGQVVQRGSHEELEKQEGLYKELWNAQAKYYA